jgi:hypothetical protein
MRRWAKLPTGMYGWTIIRGGGRLNETNGSMHKKLVHQKVSLDGGKSNNIENSIARWVGFGKNITPGFSEEHFNLDASDNITHKQKRNEEAQLLNKYRRTR